MLPGHDPYPSHVQVGRRAGTVQAIRKASRPLIGSRPARSKITHHAITEKESLAPLCADSAAGGGVASKRPFNFPDASPIRGCRLKNFAHVPDRPPRIRPVGAAGGAGEERRKHRCTRIRKETQWRPAAISPTRASTGAGTACKSATEVARGAWSGLPAKRVNRLSGPDRRKGSRPGAARFHLRMSNASSSTSRARFVSTMQPRFSS